MTRQSLPSQTGNFIFGRYVKSEEYSPSVPRDEHKSFGLIDGSFDDYGTLAADVVDGRTSMVNSDISCK